MVAICIRARVDLYVNDATSRMHRAKFRRETSLRCTAHPTGKKINKNIEIVVLPAVFYWRISLVIPGNGCQIFRIKISCADRYSFGDDVISV